MYDLSQLMRLLKSIKRPTGRSLNNYVARELHDISSLSACTASYIL